MFSINEDMSIYVTRGDIVIFRVTADENGAAYKFRPGDVVRIKVTEKKACENVVLQKDFAVTEETETVDIILTEQETKIGEVISKPVDYWYEIELNPFDNPQTIVGYDDDGPKIFKLFPEGKDAEALPIEPEDIPIVDSELDVTSERPVENQAVARAIAELNEDVAIVHARFNNFATLKQGSTSADAELVDIRVGTDGTIYESAGDSVRGQINKLIDRVNVYEENLEEPVRMAVESAGIAVDAKEDAEQAASLAKDSEAVVLKAVEDAMNYNDRTVEMIQNNETTVNELFNSAKEYNEQTISMLEETNKRLGLAEFEMDDEGYLNYTDDTAYEFEIDDNGLLNYTLTEGSV